MAPNTVPGKKPAAMAPAGNAGQEVERSVVVQLVDFSDEGEGTGVIVAWGVVGVVNIVVVDGDVVVDELDIEAVAVVAASLSKAHVLFPWQV